MGLVLGRQCKLQDIVPARAPICEWRRTHQCQVGGQRYCAFTVTYQFRCQFIEINLAIYPWQKEREREEREKKEREREGRKER